MVNRLGSPTSAGAARTRRMLERAIQRAVSREQCPLGLAGHRRFADHGGAAAGIALVENMA